MDAVNKLAGSAGCFLIVGASATPMPTGKSAYSALIRVDATQIKSVTERHKDPSSGADVDVAVTNYSWQGVGLLAGDIITFEFPVVSITLNAAGDSVLTYLEQTV
jgi:hypothetical protein